MFACPHCHKVIETSSKSEVPFWRKNLTPGLSTGSLLAIAFVVVLCSGYGSRGAMDRLHAEVRALTKTVDELKSSVAVLTAQNRRDEVAAP